MNWIKQWVCRHDMVLMSRQEYRPWGKVSTVERCHKCNWWRVETKSL